MRASAILFSWIVLYISTFCLLIVGENEVENGRQYIRKLTSTPSNSSLVKPVLIIFFQGQEGSSHLESLLKSNGLCSLGYEATDCYEKTGNCSSTNFKAKNDLIEALIQASQSPNKDAFVKNIRHAEEVSEKWNHHKSEIDFAYKECDFDKTTGFFIKARWISGLYIRPSHFQVHYATLFRNPVHQAVSGKRMAAGYNQFHESNASLPVKMEGMEALFHVEGYMNHWHKILNWLNSWQHSFLSINYEDLKNSPARLIKTVFADMDLPKPTNVETTCTVPPCYKQAVSDLYKKISNFKEFCHECSQGRFQKTLYPWIEDDCEAAGYGQNIDTRPPVENTTQPASAAIVSVTAHKK